MSKDLYCIVIEDNGIFDVTENEDGDPEEFIEIAQGRSCEEVLRVLRGYCEEFLMVMGLNK